MQFEVVTKIAQDVKPEIATHIAHEFLEWLDVKGYAIGWRQLPGYPEPVHEVSGEPFSYQELAEQFIEAQRRMQEQKYD